MCLWGSWGHQHSAKLHVKQPRKAFPSRGGCQHPHRNQRGITERLNNQRCKLSVFRTSSTEAHSQPSAGLKEPVCQSPRQPSKRSMIDACVRALHVGNVLPPGPSWNLHLFISAGAHRRSLPQSTSCPISTALYVVLTYPQTKPSVHNCGYTFESTGGVLKTSMPESTSTLIRTPRIKACVFVCVYVSVFSNSLVFSCLSRHRSDRINLSRY